MFKKLSLSTLPLWLIILIINSDTLQNFLADYPLDEKTHPEGGQHNSMRWGPRMDKRKGELTIGTYALGFFSAEAMWLSRAFTCLTRLMP